MLIFCYFYGMKIMEDFNGTRSERLQLYHTFTHKRCRICSETKPVDEFYKDKTKNKLGWRYRDYCKKCSCEKCRIYAAGNKQKRNARISDYRKRNPDAFRSIDKRKRLKHKYGISVEQLENMKIQQQGKCFICGQEKELVVDHCHVTGVVRKLLCHGCNTYLGRIEHHRHLVDQFEAYIKTHETTI